MMVKLNGSASRLLDNGYTWFDTCYENAEGTINAAKAKGYVDIKAVRVRTDTPGLKMFIVFVKE